MYNPGLEIAIVGGGLAGTACAYVLKQAEHSPVLFEAGDTLAAGASGNSVGMINPRFFALKSPEADFYIDAFEGVGRLFPHLEGISYRQHGSLHLITDATKRQRFEKMIANWGWEGRRLRIVSSEEASDLAGIALTHDCLWIPEAGSVSPQALCEMYAAETEVRLGKKVADLRQTESGWIVDGEFFDVVILACAAAVKEFPYTQDLPVYTVRGQVTKLAATDDSKNLKTNLCYGGYLTPAMKEEGTHVCGSTFQKWLTHTQNLTEDDLYNIAQLHMSVPSLSDLSTVTGHRAALRTSSKDRLPFIGQVFDRSKAGIPNMYISTAHGSHGIIGTLQTARLILQMLEKEKIPPYASGLSCLRSFK